MKKVLLHIASGISKRRWLILSAVIPIFIVIFVVVFLTKDETKPSWYLCISIKSSVNTQMQIFYDVGKGLNPTDSTSLDIKQSKKEFISLRVLLPNKPIYYIRIDPLNQGGSFMLKDIKILNGFNQIIYPVDINAVQPLNQISNMSIRNNILSADTITKANDPMMFLDLEYPLVNKGNTILIRIYNLLLLSCGFILLYVIYIFFRNIIIRLKQSGNSNLFRNKWIINSSIVTISTIASIVLGYTAYIHLKQLPAPVVYQGHGSDYALSFYNSKGQKLSKQNGTLKLKLDPFTIYRNYPNQKAASYTINNDGFRDSYLNPNAEQLAIVIGGSAAFGQGLNDNIETFSSHISRFNSKYNVINAGTVGFLSGQELSQMIHVLDYFTPSLYIVFDGWNDLFEPYMYAHGWPTNGGPIGFNHVFFRIENQLASAVQKEQNSKKETTKPLHIARRVFRNESEYFKKVLANYISNIDKMNAYANARNASFLIIFQPELGNKKKLSPIEKQLLKKWNKKYKYIKKGIPRKYTKLIHNAKLFCKENNIAYMDINEEPKFSENSKTLFYDIVHPNEQGHKIIAELINDILISKF